MTEEYKAFEGSFLEQSFLMKQEGYKMLPISSLAKVRINPSENPVGQSTLNWATFTSDVIAHYSNWFRDEYKVVPNCQLLEKLGSEVRIIDGRILINKRIYDSLEGEVFTRGQINQMREDGFNCSHYYPDRLKSCNQENPIWRALLGSKKKAIEYADSLEEVCGDRRVMSIILPESRENELIVLYDQGFSLGGGTINFSTPLNSSDSRIIGVRQ